MVYGETDMHLLAGKHGLWRLLVQHFHHLYHGGQYQKQLVCCGFQLEGFVNDEGGSL